MSIVRPSLLLDFINASRYLDPRVAYARTAGTNGRATYFDAAGNMVEAPANQARFDHTIGGTPLGVLIETGPTVNQLHNPRHEGSSGGALSSGNLPNGWSISAIPGGLTVSREADQVRNGMNGMVLRLLGTATGTMNIACAGNSTSTSVGQHWTSSIYLALVGGSIANVTNTRLRCFSSGGSVGEGVFSPSVLNGTPQRRTTYHLADTTTVGTHFQVGVSGAVDCYLWIGPAQLENRIFPTSQVLPVAGVTNATSERRGDTLSALLADFGITSLGVEGTALLDFVCGPSGTGGTQVPLEFSDGTTSNIVRWSRISAGSMNVNITVGGVSQGSLYTPVGFLTDYTRYVSAAAWSKDGYAHCMNGQIAYDSDPLPTIPLTVVYFGSTGTPNGQIGGHLRRIAIYQRRLPDAVLQSLTS